jgi:hypothetical protein
MCTVSLICLCSVFGRNVWDLTINSKRGNRIKEKCYEER